MKCPKCNSERLTSELVELVSDLSIEFKVECLDCKTPWLASKVVFPFIPPDVEKHWANVEDPIARYARESREIQDGIDKGECPKCGDPLVRKAKNYPESPGLVCCDVVCRKCKWWHSSAVSYKDWAEDKKKIAKDL